MTPPTNRLADTIRKPTGKTSGRTVKSTLRNGSGSESDLTRRTTVYLSEDNWRALKIATVEDDASVSQVIDKLVGDYLRKRNKKR